MRAVKWWPAERQSKSRQLMVHTPEDSCDEFFRNLSNHCRSSRAAKTARDLTKSRANSRDPSRTLRMTALNKRGPQKQLHDFARVTAMARSMFTARESTISKT